MSEKTIVAIDIGATKTVVARYRNGEMTPVDRFPTSDDPASEVDTIVRAVKSNGSLNDGAPVAIGIGCPGPLNPRTGTMLEPPNLKGWWGYPLVGKLEDALGLPVRLENDANLGALGESVFGSGKGYRSMFYLTLSTGIGAGLIIDGKIFAGYRAMAGEVWAIDTGAFTGTVTGQTVLELASGPGLVRSAIRKIAAAGNTAAGKSSLSPTGLDTRTLFAAADAGDPIAVDTLKAGQNAIAGLLMMVLMTVAPESIVLAGGLCTESRWFVDPVTEIVRRNLQITQLRDIPITRAELWDQAVLYGAAHLVASL